ncbi:hypothetical protein BP6252_03186 [Coleophoma cylindrospora]|uniref:Uncharacterized protein n=1 Tax=Coleophoma cylindrospora TaxID=1849047 RepID=A0A3D8S7N7_9HELO|nr:hypothetical protein BP6252_03186 [Coleophoma cylindrospora]
MVQQGSTREFKIWFKKDPQGLWQVCSRTACENSKVAGSTWWIDCDRVDGLAPDFQEAIDRFRDSRQSQRGPIATTVQEALSDVKTLVQDLEAPEIW